MITRTLAAKVLLGVGSAGLVVSLAGTVVGLRFLAELDTALTDTLAVTGEALDALDSTVEVAERTIALLEGSLADTEATTRELVSAFGEGEALLLATAELSEDQIASSLQAVEDALPGLIEVAGVMDATLSTLSTLPFGPTYDPEEPFDESLRGVQREMAGLPDDLREQAELVRGAAGNLGEVRDGTIVVADNLAALQDALGEAADLLAGYADTADEASTLVAERQAGLGLHLRLAGVLVVALGLVLAAGQVVPLGLGWLLLRQPGFGGLPDPEP